MKGREKSVRFPQEESDLASQVIEIENRLDISEEDKKTLWSSRSDCHFCRSSARVISKEAERYGYSKNLDGVYVTAASEAIQHKLNMWVLHGHSRRGLERWANTSHGQSRKEDQFIYIKGIINAQHDLRTRARLEAEEASSATATSDVPPRRDDAERLRQVGHVLSRKSRLFAQMIGAADHHAVRCEYGMVDAATQAMSNMGITTTSSGGVVAAMPSSSRFSGPPRTSAHIRRSLGLSGMPAAAAATLAGQTPPPPRINLHHQNRHRIVPGLPQSMAVPAAVARGHVQTPTAATSINSPANGLRLESTPQHRTPMQAQRRPSRSGRVPRVA